MANILELPSNWQKKWEEASFREPTPIQTQLYPLLTEGKSVLGISPTGSGKTLAYLLPLLQTVTKGKGTQLLVLLPSQELASQVAKVTRDWATEQELFVQTIVGGANVKRQLERLKKRPEVIVGTPGRILELIKTKKIKSHLVNTIVLDEVDDLVADQEYNATKNILKSVLADTQIVAVSATGQVILPELDSLFREHPEVVDVTSEDTSKGDIIHGYIATPTRKKTDVLRRLAHVPNFRGLVFFNQVSELGVVSERLAYLGINHRTLASDQHQVERKRAIDDFSKNRVPLLLTTDLGARGLDFDGLDYVIQHDVPRDAKDYIHRSGRVGRMGRSGTVLSLVNEGERKELQRLLREYDLTTTELFATHGAVLAERVEQDDEMTVPLAPKAKEKPVVKRVEQPSVNESSEPKEDIIPKKKKKKNRINRGKDKGAKWKH